MPEIRNVRIEEIQDIGVPPVRSIFTGLPVAIPQSPPVTVTIGSPIVDIPGCVEYNPNGPGLVKDDPNGTYTLCDGQVPSFNPIEYEPDGMVMTGPPEPLPEVDGSTPEIPETPTLDTPLSAPPATAIIEKKEEKAVEVIEEPTFVEQYLPSAEEVSTTVLIASAAAMSAVFGKPLAEFLLKLIKPLVKKVIQKAKDKIGVKEKVLSVAERRQLQRELRKE
ncbi:MAG: hypothetical protein ACYS5F_14805 [Planctomycetota bacterium]|jgi:hypothetical protein